MKNKFITTALSFLAGIGLVYIGLKIFLSPDQVKILVEKPFTFHLYSCLLAVPMYLLSGIASFILFRTVSKINISLYDVLTLPFVINLWGFLVPIQGSYLYNSIYFKQKYKISIENTTSIYLLSLSISFIIAGISGIIYSCTTPNRNIYFLALSVMSFIHPIFIFAFLNIFRKFNTPEHKFIKKLMLKIETIVNDYLRALNLRNVSLLGAVNLVDSLMFAVWSLWICTVFGFNLSFTQLLLLAFFMKLTQLIKLTPGNMGINQFASSGIVLLAGGLSAEGFTLSLYQTAIYIITSFLIGSVFSIVNLKYFFKREQHE
jgi:hypothetical protein